MRYGVTLLFLLLCTTGCSTTGSDIRTQQTEIYVPTYVRLDDALLEREPIPPPPNPDAVDPLTLRPTIKQRTLENWLAALLFWAHGIDSQFRDIITAQPEK